MIAELCHQINYTPEQDSASAADYESTGSSSSIHPLPVPLIGPAMFIYNGGLHITSIACSITFYLEYSQPSNHEYDYGCYIYHQEHAHCIHTVSNLSISFVVSETIACDPVNRQLKLQLPQGS